MIAKDLQQVYRAPVAKVVELSTSGLICDSPEQLDEQDYSNIF